MKFDKNLIISSESDIDTITTIEIREHKFKHPYDAYDVTSIINTTALIIKSNFYIKAKNVGSLNFIKIPFKISSKCNVLSFRLSNNSGYIDIHDPIINLNIFHNNYVFIREIKPEYYFYEIKDDKIKYLPFYHQHSSEVKYKLNNIKKIYNKINIQINHLLLLKSELLHKIINDDKTNGYYDGFYIDNDGYKYPHINQIDPRNPDVIIDKFNRLNLFIYTKLPILAMYMYNEGSKIIFLGTTTINDIYIGYDKDKGNSVNTLDFQCLTPYYVHFKNIIDLLEQLKIYTNIPIFYDSPVTNIDNEIIKLKNFINDENIIDNLLEINFQAVKNTLGNNLELKYNLYGPVQFDIFPEMIFSPEKEEVNMTFEKLDIMISKFKNNVINVLDILDESILLLNNLDKFKDQPLDVKYDDFIKKEDMNILSITNNQNEETILYYGLCHFYFNNMLKYPTLSFKKAKDDILLNKLTLDNLKRLLSKLLLGIEGFLTLNKEKKIISIPLSNKIIDSTIIDEDNLILNFINQINKNKILNILEKKAYYNCIKGSHIIYNPNINGYQIHPHLLNLNCNLEITDFLTANLDLLDPVLKNNILYCLNNLAYIYNGINFDKAIMVLIIIELIKCYNQINKTKHLEERLITFNSNSKLNNINILLKTV